jgi:hypothetical protein
MSIQDWILASCQCASIVAIFPTLIGEQKPPLATSLPSAIILAIMAVTFGTISMWVSTVSTAVLSLCWFVLVWQSVSAIVHRVFDELFDWSGWE